MQKLYKQEKMDMRNIKCYCTLHLSEVVIDQFLCECQQSSIQFCVPLSTVCVCAC